MKTQIRLNSVVTNGVSGPEAAATDLIYGYLLSKNGQTGYRYISINQIGEESDEVILKDGNKIYANIRYESPLELAQMSDYEKNIIRLDVLHTGMMRVADKFKKLDVEILESIRQEILNKKFLFEIPGKKFVHKKNKNLSAAITVTPASKVFDYYLQIQNGDKLLCRHLIYRGLPSIVYAPDLFAIADF